MGTRPLTVEQHRVHEAAQVLARANGLAALGRPEFKRPRARRARYRLARLLERQARPRTIGRAADKLRRYL